MEIAYVLIGLAILVGLLLLLGSKKQPPSLPEPRAEKRAPEPKRERVDKRAEPARAAERVVSERAPAPAEPAPAPPDDLVGASLPQAIDAMEDLRRGLSRSRDEQGFFGRLRALFAGKREIGPEIVAQIEEVLLSSDVGVETTNALLERVKTGLDKGDLRDADKVWDALAEEAKALLAAQAGGPLEVRARPTVVLLVGVNGAGKTTSIGKLATKFQAADFRCVLAAGDTFRAAAVQQLVVWGERVGCEVVRGKDGADPGSVVFDAIKKAQESGADLVLADTAGRLHTKANLMGEMKKIARTAEKALPGAPHEILLVIDATNGQNALAQAKEFRDALPLTGIVLTKLDGTAKGGVILGIAHALKLPVRFVGLGERPDDLHEFHANDFVQALLGREAD